MYKDVQGGSLSRKINILNDLGENFLLENPIRQKINPLVQKNVPKILISNIAFIFDRFDVPWDHPTYHWIR